MPASHLNLDIDRAKQLWAEYQKMHDVADRTGQAVGIDPVSGRIWFGESGVDIRNQIDADGVNPVIYLTRVGSRTYVRKGGR